MKNKYIYTNNNSISKELCYEIIKLYEEEDAKFEGTTIGGLNKQIKDTVDFIIKPNDKKWYKIYNFLMHKLNKSFQEYEECIEGCLLLNIF